MTTTERTREEEFTERVVRLDTGELAKLRRGCGERDPVEGRCPWLLGLVHGVASEPTAFLIASLLAQYKTTVIRAGGHRLDGNFGLTWKRAIAGNASKSIRRRFHILLDADYDLRTGDGDLPHHLRQMVRYAAGKGVGVDWPALLRHVRAWDSPTKWVQKEWARSFFSDQDPGEPKVESEEKE
ncbi:MAG: type I-E CRISPR-associated protein Cse2/CasB [Chloroflexi bacterium]|nr:type I-E CRISPR-associated protein Cse2/CasB [Chloroflexota bacterium]